LPLTSQINICEVSGKKQKQQNGKVFASLSCNFVSYFIVVLLISQMTFSVKIMFVLLVSLRAE